MSAMARKGKISFADTPLVRAEVKTISWPHWKLKMWLAATATTKLQKDKDQLGATMMVKPR